MGCMPIFMIMWKNTNHIKVLRHYPHKISPPWEGKFFILCKYISILAPRVLYTAKQWFCTCSYSLYSLSFGSASQAIIGRMSYQYNYNHFEQVPPSYPVYGYPWMPSAAPGLLRSPQNCPSSPHTESRNGSETCERFTCVETPVPAGAKATNPRVYTVALKIISPQNKRDYQQHSLRNIDPRVISTPQELKEEISMQVGVAVSRFQEFPVGFYQESKKMWIQNKEDLQDAWLLLERNKNLTCGATGMTAVK